jgi:hypothetical protein
LQDLIEKGEKQPNLTIGILVSVVVVIFTILFKVIFGGKKNVSIVPLSFGILFSVLGKLLRKSLGELFTRLFRLCAGKSGKEKYRCCRDF